ncbi:MAG: hypothetical protein J6M16_08035 [Clostridia bacterium]|nr:hypothetical protein [Clostridia bacterium]
MAYIRDRREELTGYQQGDPWTPTVDLGNDFVMVYAFRQGKALYDLIQQFKSKGYVIHLMTGSAWGGYRDYYGFPEDEVNKLDESQLMRNGEHVRLSTPYMVPTVEFSDYLTERLKIAVDAGVEAIHLEEPEFWDKSGYSEGFKREYEVFYDEKWTPPHENLEVRYKASKLKAHLYRRCLSRVSESLKEYAKKKYNRQLKVYVPTHSLVNYTQWKIISPEASLIDIPSIDGCIAQVWTGTSRVANVYNGIYKERTFETAFLEYGIMQELVKGTGRKMWFLCDPIEDSYGFTWANYEYNYKKTLVASLLHPKVHRYEISPWPWRVFNDNVYPLMTKACDKSAPPAPNATRIPKHYSTLLSGTFQMLGDMNWPDYKFENINSGVGVLMSDSGLFQRTFPDGIVQNSINDRLEAVHNYNSDEGELKADKELMDLIEKDNDALLSYVESGAFPNFFGMAMPLLKYGLPVTPVQLDNIRRFPGYLSDYKTLILSYEYMKPESPDVNMALYTWVMEGGTLIYIGDGIDPYHGVSSWWKNSGYSDPAMHLFKLFGYDNYPENGTFSFGKGKLAMLNLSPARLTLNEEISREYREFIKNILLENGEKWDYRNDITIRRGPYVISAVMDESVNNEPKVIKGNFVDMLSSEYNIIKEKVINPDEGTILFDLDYIKDETFRILASGSRIFNFDITDEGFTSEMKAADLIKSYIRVRLPKKVTSVSAIDEDGNNVEVTLDWDEESRSALMTYESTDKLIKLTGEFI